MSVISEFVESKYGVFNRERFARYKLLIATGIRDKLDDIIEATEQETESRPTGPKRKQKAGRSPRRQNTK